MESPDISVVVLAYRSASTIEGFVASLVTSLEEEKIDWEIILVGNYFEGVGDQTPEVVQRISDGNPRIKTVVKVKEGMMGWDMKSGLRAATGKKLAVIDGDGQMPCTDVARVYNLMTEQGCDLAKRSELKGVMVFTECSFRLFTTCCLKLCFRESMPGI